MTDKAVVKWPIMQISTLLRLKHCLQSHIESTSCNEFKRRFLHFLATSRATIGSAVSQQTLRTVVYSKEFRWQWRNLRSATKIKDQLRAFCSCIGPHWKQIDVKRWGLIIPHWNLPQVYSHNVKENVLNSHQFLEKDWKFFWRPEVTRHYKKIPSLYLRKNLLAYSQEFKGKWTI